MMQFSIPVTSSATLLSTCTFAFADLTLGRMVTCPKKHFTRGEAM